MQFCNSRRLVSIGVGTHVLLDLRLVHLESVVTFVQNFGAVLPGDVRRGPGCSHCTLEQNLRPLHHVAHHTVQIHLQWPNWKIKMYRFYVGFPSISKHISWKQTKKEKKKRKETNLEIFKIR